MDFNCCLLSSLLRSPSLAMQEFRDDVTAHARIVREYEIRVVRDQKIRKFSEFSNLNNSANTQWNHFKFGE